MKKVKASQIPQSRQEFVLYPSRLRMGLIYAGFFAVAVLAGWLIRVGVNGGKVPVAELFADWYINLAIVVGGAFLFALLDYSRWTIRVYGSEKVEGPSGALGERTDLPLKEIDWARSSRSLNSWLKVGNAIYTVGRRRILISPWFYDGKIFAEFLKRIGSPQK